MRYAVFQTPLGWVAARAGKKGIGRLTPPVRSRRAALSLLGKLDSSREVPDAFRSLEQDLRAYLEGRIVSFSYPIDMDGLTPFQRQVLRMVATIPYGETRSYSWVAQATGKPAAQRAVGQALAANPLPLLIPCHRVIGKDGDLGGYTGGVKLKRRLLELEARQASASSG